MDPEYKNIEKKEKPYHFNGVFADTSNNLQIFEAAIKYNLSCLIEGYNSTYLAYGITGSGKTFTVFGRNQINYELEDQGISFLAIDYIINSTKHL